MAVTNFINCIGLEIFKFWNLNGAAFDVLSNRSASLTFTLQNLASVQLIIIATI